MDSPNKIELRNNLIKFRNLLNNSKYLGNNFLINSEMKKSKAYFSLREKKTYKRRNFPRKILLTISLNPEFYSIKSFKLINNEKEKASQNQLFSIKIEGNNNTTEIFKNLMDIIRGKDQTIYNPNQPFSV